MTVTVTSFFCFLIPHFKISQCLKTFSYLRYVLFVICRKEPQLVLGVGALSGASLPVCVYEELRYSFAKKIWIVVKGTVPVSIQLSLNNLNEENVKLFKNLS